MFHLPLERNKRYKEHSWMTARAWVARREYQQTIHSSTNQQTHFQAIHSIVLRRGGGTRNKLSFKKRISTHYYSWGDTHNKLDESIDINNNSNHKHNLVLTSKLVQSWASRCQRHPCDLALPFHKTCLRRPTRLQSCIHPRLRERSPIDPIP